MSLIDADTVACGSTLSTDVCVVGSGAAGIPLALRLAENGLSVLLLESGYDRPDGRTQSLYCGEVADDSLHSPPHKYRQRRFGGSTGIWGGRCVPFDPIDFEARPYVPLSGWPISFGDISCYYPEANEIAEAGEYAYDADAVFAANIHPLFEGFRSPVVGTNSLERFSCPTDFAVRYRDRLRVSPHITAVMGANCTAIRLDSDGSSVKHLDISTLRGNTFSVTARQFVLATGGLETPRLLLSSRDVSTTGVGNEHDVVGRYYMCHIAGNVGTLTINGPTSNVNHAYLMSPDGIYCRRRLAVRESEQRRLQLCNMVARLHFSRITDPAHRNGVLSMLFLARKLISYEYGKRLHDGSDPTLQTYLAHIRNVFSDSLETTAFLLRWLSRRTLAERKYPSVILGNRSNRFSLEIHSEQIPLRESRISLTSNADELGMPRLRIDWRYSKADIESVRRTLDVFSSEFERTGTGSYEYDRETLEEDLLRFGAYGGHHIGTTRMGDDPTTSVVNADCRVHSVRNLYISGSAVFPTSSQANPTLTIIALALRLADHLRSVSR